MSRLVLALLGVIGALGCARGDSTDVAPGRPGRGLELARVEARSGRDLGGAYATVAAPSPAPSARVRVRLFAPASPADDLAHAPLADGALALEATRRDGTSVLSFRRGADHYELGALAAEDELLWLRALDPAADDRAPPRALIGVSRGALVRGGAVPLAIESERPRPGTASVVVRVRDGHGAPRAHVTAAPIPDAEPPLFDDGHGGLAPRGETGPRGVIVFAGIDGARETTTVSLGVGRVARTYAVKLAPDVVTAMVVAIDE